MEILHLILHSWIRTVFYIHFLIIVATEWLFIFSQKQKRRDESRKHAGSAMHLLVLEKEILIFLV